MQRPGRHGDHDAIVVGSGPNGLAAAVTLAQAGLSVTVVEGSPSPGGGCRTEELTLPGFRHDVCSAVHPFVLASPFFAQPAFDDLRASLRHPEVPFAQSLGSGRAVACFRSIARTAAQFGADGPRYRRLVEPLSNHAEDLFAAVTSPLRSVPGRPLALARFGMAGLVPLTRLASWFTGDGAPALLAGAAAHSMLPLTAPMSSAFALILALSAHAVGWPVVAGGSVGVTEALVAELERLGGTVVTGRWVEDLDDLPPARVVLVDAAPAGLVRMAARSLPDRYVRALERFRHHAGVCKVDWALSEPVPWLAEECRRAGTVHVGGSMAEVAASEAAVAAGRHPGRPFTLVVQPTGADPTRAPAGKATLWAYCHVPLGSPADLSPSIEAQIERFAPGFSDVILARSVVTAAELTLRNPSYVGGDIGGGAPTFRQTLFRPTVRWNPYRTPTPGLYLCSASTPPGGGVHGMCGWFAARTALFDHFGGPAPFRAFGPGSSRRWS